MAALFHSKSRRLYSWWWACHNSSTNSKWLQENIADMDAKVIAMIKFIEEDARTAVMYRNKSPELMKLVEEFFRDHIALAENYNDVSGDLRQAHRNIAQAFHDQAHRKGLKQLNGMITQESVLPSTAKTELKIFKKILDRLFVEKTGLVAQNSSLISQLKINTEIIQSLLEKKTSLQISLCGSNYELDGLRAKLKGLEEVCQLLRTSERFNLLSEKSSLVSRIEMMEQKLDKQEMKFSNLEEKYSNLEKKKESTLCQVDQSEVILPSEIHEKSSEFELWGAEASSFYFYHQISSEREVLFQNKVYDLGSLCEGLNGVSNRRSVEIEKKKPRVSSIENEAEALKSQIHYGLVENSSTLSHSYSLSELQNLQSRIQVIENLLNIEKETAVSQKHRNAITRLKPGLNKIDNLKSQTNNKKLEKKWVSTKDRVCQTSEVKIVEQEKDIPRKLGPKTRKIRRE